MSYIETINIFWQEAPNAEGYKSEYATLFFSLLDSINKNYWKETEIDLEIILFKSGLTKRSYLSSRKWLAENGFITLAEGRNDYQRAKVGVLGAVRFCTATCTANCTASSTATCTSTAPLLAPIICKDNRQEDNRQQTFCENDFSHENEDVELSENIENQPIILTDKKTKKKEAEYTIVHKIRRLIEAKSEGYYWKAKDARNAKELAGQIIHRFKASQARPPTDEEIINALDLIITNLPEFWADKWDVSILNSKFEIIVNQIKNGKDSKKRQQQFAEAEFAASYFAGFSS